MKPKNDKQTLINGVLWAAFLLAIGASIQHLAWTFGTVERYPALGWIAAVSVDAGLAALAYSIQQRKRAKRKTTSLWAGVGFFAFISALANFYHAIGAETGGEITASTLASLDWLLVSKALLLSATLPLLVLYLGEIVSGDDAAEAERKRKEAEREARRNEQEAAQAKEEAEQEATPPAASDTQAIACPHCERTFATLNALNAHARVHSNGKAVQSQTN